MDEAVGILVAILFLALIFLGPPAVVGAVAGGFMRASATRRRLSAEETNRKARNGFWIGAVIAIAAELVLVGLCISSMSQIG